MLPASASPPARPRPAAADDEDADADALYRAAERGILERLDILAVCRDLGVRIAGSPTAKGWLPVHAVGREDAQASAAVGIEGPVKGRSVDLGSGVRCSLWELAVLCGRFSDWRGAPALRRPGRRPAPPLHELHGRAALPGLHGPRRLPLERGRMNTAR